MNRGGTGAVLVEVPLHGHRGAWGGGLVAPDVVSGRAVMVPRSGAGDGWDEVSVRGAGGLASRQRGVTVGQVIGHGVGVVAWIAKASRLDSWVNAVGRFGEFTTVQSEMFAESAHRGLGWVVYRQGSGDA